MQLNQVSYYVTPIQKLNENLKNNSFYLKRDDLFPFFLGGNKARKAVLFFEDIKRKNCDCVVTYGSSSSNHCRVIANIAEARGMPCYLITPMETSRPTTNSKIMEILGATIKMCPVTKVEQTIKMVLAKLKKQGYNPYFIPGGGHNNIGTRAYIYAYEEIINYEKKTGVYFDYIFHVSGTGTTQAGLVCGKLINNQNRVIVGVSNARKNPHGGQVVLESVNNYLNSIGKELATSEAINFVDDYVLDGYGSYNNAILQTIKEVLNKDGIPMDTTYTGKGFWGMKEYIKKKQIKGKNILFIHTGGTPLFFDDLDKLVRMKK
ncbi:MAG: pyridoxal-phosphate dependent enzyme [Clostridiaceae bacterium]|nr:pyridoxal-phosphate dependent enzyme [Clostridiaceae bacterium]